MPSKLGKGRLIRAECRVLIYPQLAFCFVKKTKQARVLRTCLFLIVLQRSFALRLALQQAENVLLGGIGLGQHRGGRLLQDLVFGQVCGFQSKVCILDAAFGSRQVGRDVGQVVHSVVQPVGHRTQFGMRLV